MRMSVVRCGLALLSIGTLQIGVGHAAPGPDQFTATASLTMKSGMKHEIQLAIPLSNAKRKTVRYEGDCVFRNLDDKSSKPTACTATAIYRLRRATWSLELMTDVETVGEEITFEIEVPNFGADLPVPGEVLRGHVTRLHRWYPYPSRRGSPLGSCGTQSRSEVVDSGEVEITVGGRESA